MQLVQPCGFTRTRTCGFNYNTWICGYCWLYFSHPALSIYLADTLHDSGCQSAVGYSVSLKSFDVFLLQISHLERGSLRLYQGSRGGQWDCLHRDRHLAIAIIICCMHKMHSFDMHSRISIYKSCLFLPFRSHDLWSCASYCCADVHVSWNTSMLQSDSRLRALCIIHTL